MLNKTALTIGLSILLSTEATPDDAALAKEAIDSFMAKNGGSNGVVTSATLMTEGSATQTTSTTAQAGAVELDKEGVPWDERIHSGSRALTEKGVWKKRKGVDDNLYRTLTAQLKAQVSGNAGVAIQTEQAAQPAGVSLPGAGVQLPGAAPALPALQLQPAVDPNYTELVALVGRGINAGVINDAWVRQSLVTLGVGDGELQSLAHSPQLVANVLQQFKAAGLS